jgi:hypothetical protein
LLVVAAHDNQNIEGSILSMAISFLGNRDAWKSLDAVSPQGFLRESSDSLEIPGTPQRFLGDSKECPCKGLPNTLKTSLKGSVGVSKVYI